MPSAGFERLAAALALVPRKLLKTAKLTRPKSVIGKDPKAKRVALMLGCVQEVLAPSISLSAIRLLRRHGVDVVIVKDETCCGALVHSLGKEEEARDYARRNIDAWTAVIRERPLDAILVTTSGCGTMVKDYGNLLARDRGYAERAAYVAELARDITEFISEIGLMPPVLWTGLRVAYHAPCSLQHGQQHRHRAAARCWSRPGFTVARRFPKGISAAARPAPIICSSRSCPGNCASGSSPISPSVEPDVIVTGNIGCMMQLQGGRRRPSSTPSSCSTGRPAGRRPTCSATLKAKGHPIETLVELAKQTALVD